MKKYFLVYFIFILYILIQYFYYTYNELWRLSWHEYLDNTWKIVSELKDLSDKEIIGHIVLLNSWSISDINSFRELENQERSSHSKKYLYFKDDSFIYALYWDRLYSRNKREFLKLENADVNTFHYNESIWFYVDKNFVYISNKPIIWVKDPTSLKRIISFLWETKYKDNFWYYELNTIKNDITKRNEKNFKSISIFYFIFQFIISLVIIPWFATYVLVRVISNIFKKELFVKNINLLLSLYIFTIALFIFSTINEINLIIEIINSPAIFFTIGFLFFIHFIIFIALITFKIMDLIKLWHKHILLNITLSIIAYILVIISIAIIYSRQFLFWGIIASPIFLPFCIVISLILKEFSLLNKDNKKELFLNYFFFFSITILGFILYLYLGNEIHFVD